MKDRIIFGSLTKKRGLCLSRNIEEFYWSLSEWIKTVIQFFLWQTNRGRNQDKLIDKLKMKAPLNTTVYLPNSLPASQTSTSVRHCRTGPRTKKWTAKSLSVFCLLASHFFYSIFCSIFFLILSLSLSFFSHQCLWWLAFAFLNKAT